MRIQDFKLTGLVVLIALIATGVNAAPINQVAYASLTGTEIVTFDDLPSASASGTNYDSIIISGGTAIGERFDGQTRSSSGDFDVLSGSPSATLNVLTGSPDQNLDLLFYNGSNVLAGLGPLGYPNFDAVGEGSFALLFSTNQSQFGFQLVGGNGGTATVDFFRRDGSLIEEILLSGLTDTFYGFSRDGGLQDIAGISISNNDLGGIGFDNLKHDVVSNVAVPEPASIFLIALGLLGVANTRRKNFRG